MTKQTELKLILTIAAMRYINVKIEGETRASVFARDTTYSNLMKKVKILRELVGISIEDSDKMFDKEVNKIETVIRDLG